MLVRRPIDDTARYYHHERAIVMRRGLLLEDERRLLWHELVHADRGDTSGHNDRRVEQLVERWAAENAMPWCSVLWAWDEATDIEEMAGLLKLPAEWVWFRLRNLHPAKKALLKVRQLETA